ncbi:DUF4391 domain-containing protein [Enterobacter hormaechei]|uniref:DUF4391 domain-containing protein n=1 Tax=Enterobacter hormaechei TaxID=158836 RepID=UPI0011DC9B57|nr:DUF4391 domain-containing protein [Enterobacter hormaechei]TXU04654.1 DUF4391 domain-containing protein [Enterobacter hormaechei]
MSKIIDFNSGNLFDKVYEHLALPESTLLGTRITKKMILDNNDLSSSEKKLVNDVIHSVEWLNTLKPETLNIPTYVSETVEYIEVAVLKVILKADTTNSGKLKSTAKLFHTLIPYPVILLFELNGELAISLADKRINQADCSKLVIEFYYNTQWFKIGFLKVNEKEFLNDFSLKNVSSVNYYELYQDFIAKLIALETSYISNGYRKNGCTNYERRSLQANNIDAIDQLLFTEMSNEEKTRLLKQLASLEGELMNIRNKLRKELHMNEKMRLNIRAKKVKQAISQVTSQFVK